MSSRDGLPVGATANARDLCHPPRAEERDDGAYGTDRELPGTGVTAAVTSAAAPAPMSALPPMRDPDKPRLVDGTSEERKGYPMVRGLLDYFPDALADVAYGSFVGNQKHNPGEEMHHARGKSMDHADCIVRHLESRGSYDTIVAKDGTVYKVRHSTWVAWRALALLQQEIEDELGLPMPRGAKA